jgi:hypothetical protein
VKRTASFRSHPSPLPLLRRCRFLKGPAMNLRLPEDCGPVLAQSDNSGQATPQSPPSRVDSPAPPNLAPRLIDRLAVPMLVIAGLATIAWTIFLVWGLVWLAEAVLF